jgi:Fuc2NAc and GlcNAc transferase
MIYLLFTLILVFLYTHALIYLSYAYAKRHLMQAPHFRGTHTRTIPRGVGLAVVIVCLITIVTLFIAPGFFPKPFALGLLLGGVFIAGIGFIDDHQHVQPMIRLWIQSFGVIAVLYLIGGFPELYLFNHAFYVGWFGHILAFLGMLWLINLYNFIDGIDGQAGTQTVFLAINLALMAYFIDFYSLGWLMVILAASMSAFLCWNWQPAKVFMGDVCSCFLGFLFASLMALTARDNTIPLLCWLILLALPIVDMSYTLVVRLIKGYSYHEAHCSHAFQHAVARYGSHQAVVLRGLAINLFWLAPFAWIAFLQPQYDVYCFILAVAPIFYIVIKLKAGQSNDFEKFHLAPRDRFELPTK